MVKRLCFCCCLFIYLNKSTLYVNPIHVCVAKVIKISQYFSTIFKIQTFIAIIEFNINNCIQVSTNMPSIGLVVLETALDILTKYVTFCTLILQAAYKVILHKPGRKQHSQCLTPWVDPAKLGHKLHTQCLMPQVDKADNDQPYLLIPRFKA